MIRLKGEGPALEMVSAPGGEKTSSSPAPWHEDDRLSGAEDCGKCSPKHTALVTQKCPHVIMELLVVPLIKVAEANMATPPSLPSKYPHRW